jgi:hypothetical protein
LRKRQDVETRSGVYWSLRHIESFLPIEELKKHSKDINRLDLIYYAKPERIMLTKEEQAVHAEIWNRYGPESGHCCLVGDEAPKLSVNGEPVTLMSIYDLVDAVFTDSREVRDHANHMLHHIWAIVFQAERRWKELSPAGQVGYLDHLAMLGESLAAGIRYTEESHEGESNGTLSETPGQGPGAPGVSPRPEGATASG